MVAPKHHYHNHCYYGREACNCDGLVRLEDYACRHVNTYTTILKVIDVEPYLRLLFNFWDIDWTHPLEALVIVDTFPGSASYNIYFQEPIEEFFKWKKSPGTDTPMIVSDKKYRKCFSDLLEKLDYNELFADTTKVGVNNL